MRRVFIVCTVLGVGALFTASSKEFPLTFKTIPPQDVSSFPGGYGRTGSLSVRPDPNLSKEPKAVSAHPLYGQFGDRAESRSLAFRLDESQGDGKGYDQLILDLNDNSDLTDDPVIRRASGAKTPTSAASERQQALFGPIEMPASKKIGPWQPLYYGELMIYNPSAITATGDRRDFIGFLRLKAACYWEAMVELEGVRQKLGLVDADSNLRLGEPWQPQTYTNENVVNWYFSPGDSFLLDTDGSGQYNDNAFNSEFCPFGSLVYLKGVPCKVTLAADCQSIQVELWKDPLAELDLRPQGELVHSVTLAWEQQPDKWQLIEPSVAKGKVMVPPGTYRLYSCALEGKAFLRKSIMASAYTRVVKKSFQAQAGKTQPLSCGAPLDIKVDVEKGSPHPWELPQPPPADSGKDIIMLRINAHVVGAGEEIYATYGRGRNYRDDPDKPTFTILDNQGKLVAKGNLEFG
jgi:hypothetical protein